jgi:hypothetical protein
MLREARQEAAARRHELKALKDAQSQAQESALAEQGQWKELAEKRAQELEALTAQLKTFEHQQKQAALVAAVQGVAVELGIIDPEAAAKLAGLDTLEGEVSAERVREALKELVKNKPYLVKTAPELPPSNPGGSGQNDLGWLRPGGGQVFGNGGFRVTGGQ